ncbi:DUF5666 domain-containing protein [Ramlibacter alkalitolerans]|uniref:DUF5666 domain-containing protein n=1 Tax=Ramlibacter alkalitolerans TaxID=2039631 RepID=A0ABS1JKJ3_9BURK|nr:DUF5666 domain-containing protein [Ramlibacter alkalitolerans]MBL0424754.1 hypothetical protein [Ramlibacter alkalitolerans]
MSDLPASSVAPLVPRRRVLVSLLSAAGVMALPSCGGGGGGGGVAGVDTGGTGSFSIGSIVGFGSIIVNGVRFEDNAARVADDAGGVLSANDLRLGMVVRVQAGTITPGSGDVLPSATATSIIVESEIKGRVESKTGTDTLVVFGQTVKVNAATVFENVTFATIAVGNILEVSGFADAAGVITATRIEREGAANEFKVRGVIANLDAVNRTFQIGSATFIFAGSGVRLPATPLQNGQFVRVRTTTLQNAAGQWVVTRIDLRDAVEDRGEAEVEGILVQNGTALQVNGITIDTSRLAAGSVPAVGQKVEVEGQLVNGVLVASKIKLEDANEGAQVDVRGAASAVNKTAQTLVVRGLTFHYTPGVTEFRNGTVDTLVDGANVRVRGTLPTGGAGAIEATRLEFQ